MKKFFLLIFIPFCTLRAQDSSPSAFTGGEGVNGSVNALVVQADRKIVLGGQFTTVNGVPRNNLARLNADGTLDRTFTETLAQGVNGEVRALAILPNGAILVGGLFDQAGGVEAMNLVRYLPNGSVDPSPLGGSERVQPGTNGIVLALAIRADGGILVGGNFNTIFGQPRRSLALLKADGTLAAESALLSGPVKALATNGKSPSVAGGLFEVQSQNAPNLLQLK